MKHNKNQAAAAQVAAAASAPESAPASAAEKKARKSASTDAKVNFFTPLIEEEKYTAKELLDMAIESGNFPKLTESTIRTFITDSKNPRYNKFPKLVVKLEGGKLGFQKEAEAAA